VEWDPIKEDAMTTARDIMNAGVTCVGEHETLTAAAQHMRERDIGALPICGDDDRLHGMLTDRDIVVSLVAPEVDFEKLCARDVVGAPLHTAQTHDDVLEVLGRMRAHAIRRMPVVDAGGALVGILTLDDVLGVLADALHGAVALTESQMRRERVRRP
jgi:CBS domain-containing protein